MLQSLGRKLFLPHRKSGSELLPVLRAQTQELVRVAQPDQSRLGRGQAAGPGVRVNSAKTQRCQQRVMKLMLELMNEAHTDRRHPKDSTKWLHGVWEGQLWYASELPGLLDPPFCTGRWMAESIRRCAIQVTPRRREDPPLLRDEASRSYFAPANRRLLDQLALFDRILAEFELSYVSAMVPVKTMTEMDQLQEVVSRKLKQSDRDRLVRRLCLTESGDATDAEADVDGGCRPGCRLFKVIAGGADQIQSNYALELRYLLRCCTTCTAARLLTRPPLRAAASTATLARKAWTLSTGGDGLGAIGFNFDGDRGWPPERGVGRRASSLGAGLRSDVCTNRRCGQAFTSQQGGGTTAGPAAACSARPAPGLGEPCPSSDSTVQSAVRRLPASPPPPSTKTMADRA
uniref:Dynamin_M domain-containing protein n=1 Tax=Macrostomum lignano TaxID=282301 RepID=A0A1I8F5C2_9PLAT